MHFSYRPDKVEKPLLTIQELTVPQGSRIAVLSKAQGGRSTLLKLIGQRLQPTEGRIFVPTQLRVLHVSQAPLMIRGSIWSNLVFGWKDVTQDRVFSILDDMEMHVSKGCVRRSFLSYEGENGDWVHAFPRSEIAKIHLARAFIMSPEVMVMQRPDSH